MTSYRTSTSAAATAPAAAPAGLSPRLWGLLAVLAGNMLIDALEVSVMVVAMPSIGAGLGLSLTVLQWTMSGFALGFGGLMLFGGRVVALLGRRRVYLAALLVFAAASLVAGVTSDPALLIATRFVKGFCAALTAPTGLAIISTAFAEGRERGRALSVYTLFGAGGFTAGLLLSGMLTEISWRWTLVFPAPVVLLLFVFGLRLIPADEPDAAGPRRCGVTGAVSFTGSLAALVFAIAAVPGAGWGGARVLGLAALAATLFTVFLAVERGASQPLVRAGAWVNRALVRSALGAAALNGSYLGLLFVITFHLQTRLGWGPLHTGLALLPASAPLAATALLSGRMVSRFGAPKLIAVGALPPLLGHLWFLRLSAPTAYAYDVLPTLLLVAAGFVLAFAALNAQATAGAPAAERGMAGGVYQTAVQAAAVVMIALVATLLAGDVAPAGASESVVLGSYRPAVVLITGVGALGLLVGLTGLLPRTRERPPTSAPGSGPGPEPAPLQPRTSSNTVT
ncbi:MFS transporter [Streptomyces sp. NPDC051217]|uniref:MFS transporter n=1 Tax=Streptomyces sp. NPDC051217 TaxID=3365644 RepID=UPI003794C4E6